MPTSKPLQFYFLLLIIRRVGFFEDTPGKGEPEKEAGDVQDFRSEVGIKFGGCDQGRK